MESLNHGWAVFETAICRDASVDDFAAVRAPKFNRGQQAMRRWLQSFQHQLLAAYKVQ
jgi:hypothetical protein